LKVRGLAPPDDIRHRGLKWDSKIQMWVPRDLRPINADFAADAEAMRQYCGATRATMRLGRAMRLRAISARAYAARKKRRRSQIIGPYLPMIFQACREDQLAYEYRHGVQSYGAFTFSLTEILRQKRRITFHELVRQAATRLTQLGYEQSPMLLGPRKIMRSRVPWQRNGAKLVH